MDDLCAKTASTVAAVGEVVRCTTGAWMVRPPQRCGHGHELGPGRVLIGHQPCGCGRRGGHMTWACALCGEVIYAPELRSECRPLAGPAAEADILA